VAVLPAGAGAEEEVGGAAHALDAAGDDEVGVAGADRLGGEHDRLEAGAADLVDGEGGDGVGQSRLEGGLARRVLAEPRLEDVADDDLVDAVRRGAGPFECFADGDGAELRGRHLAEGAEILADGRADGGEDQGIGHESSPQREGTTSFYQPEAPQFIAWRGGKWVALRAHTQTVRPAHHGSPGLVLTATNRPNPLPPLTSQALMQQAGQ